MSTEEADFSKTVAIRPIFYKCKNRKFEENGLICVVVSS